MGAQGAGGDKDRALAALATAQHGVVSLDQLVALGFGRGAVRCRVRDGQLHRLHRAVYAVGHLSLTAHGRWLAAVLACGDGAVLSDAAATAAWELRPSSAARIDVSVPTDAGRRRRRGIRLHRRPDVRADETTQLRGIPITTPARTLVDLAGQVPKAALARAFEQAEVLRLLDRAALSRLLTRRTAQTGTRELTALMVMEPRLTRSELEQRFLQMIDRERLPRPRTNHLVLGYEVDFLWPAHRLVIETDGHRYHGTAQAFERDRHRDAQLKLAGYDVIRFTYRQVTEHADRTAATVRSLLSRER